MAVGFCVFWILLFSKLNILLHSNYRKVIGGMNTSQDQTTIEPIKIEAYQSRIEKAQGFNQIWEIVKDSVKDSLGKHRSGMLLFLDDLPLQLGAYYPVGTNNIVLNRALVNVVEATTDQKSLVNAFVYSLLTHEYLHALGYMSESEVHSLVYSVSKHCFGKDHVVAKLAAESPWTLLKDVALDGVEVPKRSMKIVKDFEKPDQRYIV